MRYVPIRKYGEDDYVIDGMCAKEDVKELEDKFGVEVYTYVSLDEKDAEIILEGGYELPLDDAGLEGNYTVDYLGRKIGKDW